MQISKERFEDLCDAEESIERLNQLITNQTKTIYEGQERERNLKHDLENRNLRIEALLYNLVLCQGIIRNREDQIRQFEARFGKLNDLAVAG